MTITAAAVQQVIGVAGIAATLTAEMTTA